MNDTAKEAVLFLGVPENILNLVLESQKLENKHEFRNAAELIRVIDLVLDSPALKLELEKKVELANQKKNLISQIKQLTKKNKLLKLRLTCRKCRTNSLVHNGITFLPCSHYVTCEACAEELNNCLICGHQILATIKTIIP